MKWYNKEADVLMVTTSNSGVYALCDVDGFEAPIRLRFNGADCKIVGGKAQITFHEMAGAEKVVYKGDYFFPRGE